jgi:DNA-binding transcriptional LysR family regulator
MCSPLELAQPAGVLSVGPSMAVGTSSRGKAPIFDELHHRQWTSYSGALSGLKACRFVEAHVPNENITCRSDSVAAAAAAIAAGLGIGYLPFMLGELNSGLVRIGPIEADLSDELWLLTHPDIRKSGRVHAFMTHCSEASQSSAPSLKAEALDV